VFDLGGGTLMCRSEVGDGVFEVKSTSGDTSWVGMILTRKLLTSRAVSRDRRGRFRRDRQALQRLMEAAEKAKIELSGVSVITTTLYHCNR